MVKIHPPLGYQKTSSGSGRVAPAHQFLRQRRGGSGVPGLPGGSYWHQRGGGASPRTTLAVVTGLASHPLTLGNIGKDKVRAGDVDTDDRVGRQAMDNNDHYNTDLSDDAERPENPRFAL